MEAADKTTEAKRRALEEEVKELVGKVFDYASVDSGMKDPLSTPFV